MGEMFNGMMDEWIPQAAKTYQDTLLGDQRFLNAKTLLTFRGMYTVD